MSRRLIVRPEAEADITEAAVWYESRESGLGLEVPSEIQAAIERVVKDPEIFPQLRKSTTVCRILARRFPYRISLLCDVTQWSCLRCFTPQGMTALGSAAFNRISSPNPSQLLRGLDLETGEITFGAWSNPERHTA
jgi:plasmid stabilization system protein ParE